MKLFLSVIGTAILAGALQAKDPVSRSSKTVPGKYPSIIQLTPVDPAAPATAEDVVFHSEIGGRELEFLQNARRASAQLLSLAEIANSKGASEQIKSVAEMLASMEATESSKLKDLAAARKLPPLNPDAGSWKKDLTSLTGAKFEKAWVERLIVVGEGSVQAYGIGAKANDPELKAFVEKMLPVAQARLQMANRLGGRSMATGVPSPPQEVSPAASK